MEKYVIKDKEDRRQMCAILAENGYSVKIEDIKVRNRACKAVVVWQEDEKKEE